MKVLGLSNACTLFLCISIYLQYDMWLQWQKTQHKYLKEDTLVSTGQWRYLLIEIVINLISPMAFL